MDNVKSKTSFAFNRISINFLKEIKNRDNNLKKKIKKNYKVYDKSSQEHIIYFWDRMNPIHDTLQDDDINLEELVTNEDFCGIYFMKGLQIGKLFTVFSSEKNTILSYILTFYLFGYLYNDISEDNYEDIDILLQKTLQVIHSIDENTDNDVLLGDILDDTVKKIILLIKTLKVHMLDSDNEQPSDNYSNMIENSKIGSIAKDICSELKDINIDPNSSPEELMNTMFNGSNNMIGNIIEQVGSSLTTKINSGQINQEELVSDAFKLLGNLNNNSSANVGDDGSNNFMSDMIKNIMGSGGLSDMMKGLNNVNTGASQNKLDQIKNKSDTRERLKKKLSEKKN